MVWRWVVPQRFVCCKLGPQCGQVDVVELLRDGAQWEVIESLKRINASLTGVLSGSLEKSQESGLLKENVAPPQSLLCFFLCTHTPSACGYFLFCFSAML
jgi:hypothetical protein